MATSQTRTEEQLIASYADPARKRHRIVLSGSLVLDLAAGEAILIAELSAEEGEDQARAVVYGGEFDVGYLARAEAGEWPLGRRLRIDDLGAIDPEPEQRPETVSDQGAGERRAA